MDLQAKYHEFSTVKQGLLRRFYPVMDALLRFRLSMRVPWGAALLAVPVLASAMPGCAVCAQDAAPLRFDFGDGATDKRYLSVGPDTWLRGDQRFGFEPGLPAPKAVGAGGKPSDSALQSDNPLRFSARLDEGTYRVRLALGGPAGCADTTVKIESRQLIAMGIDVKPGKTRTLEFLVNLRTPRVGEKTLVRLTRREPGAYRWDDKLTIELLGDLPAVTSLVIEPANDAPVLYLIGDSTVTDQTHEPYCGWGQMLPALMDGRIAVSNHSEGGRSVRSFLAEHRFKKILTTLKAGDYVMIQFGHNDMKEKGEGIGAFSSFTDGLKYMIDTARARGAHPVLVTSMHRRAFKDDGTIRDTLEDYPVAMRRLAKAERVPLIDLHKMSGAFYEAMGPVASSRAFVHYPADTYPDQPLALKDNTHHNHYGAYVLARCVANGIAEQVPGLAAYLIDAARRFDPANPPAFDAVHIPPSPPPPKPG